MKDRIVFVTGASKGIGRACAEMFLKAGSRVAAHYHSSREEAEELMHQYGDQVFLVQGDLRHTGDIEDMFDAIERHMGRVDILINNAGIVHREKFPYLTEEVFKDTFQVNTVAPFFLAQEYAKRKGNGEGAIVNIGSMRAYCPSSIDYSASKAAVHNMTVALAKTLGPHIRVNAVAPGFTKTPMHEGNDERLAKEAEKSVLKRFSSPEEIADAVFFLASDKAQSITGQILLVDNGRSLYH